MMQIRTIDSILGLQKVPVLLAGDFNSEPGSSVVEYLDKNFLRTCLNDCGFTFSSDLPVKTIDYIACRKSNPSQTLSHRVLPEAYPSDHLAILADIKVMPGNKSKRHVRGIHHS
jgi:endonuclease/exonuclease/phosphatase family metal-dependent hydrolase